MYEFGIRNLLLRIYPQNLSINTRANIQMKLNTLYAGGTDN